MAKEIENGETIESEIDQVTASQKLDEKAKKEKKKRARKKVLKVLLVVTILFLINVYFILALFYRGENFTITLDSEYGRESSLIIYERQNESDDWRNFLRSDDIEFFTDISGDWIPIDIDNGGDGSHNGRNYIAYTFYAENRGQDTINYWATIKIDDVVRNVDEAIRVMVFKNGNKVTYAKNSRETGQPEPETVPFVDEDTVMLEVTEDFKVGDVDKYTIVIWIEGDDPECKNDLIGGEIKMHMTLTEEHILQDDERPQNQR